MGLKDKIKAASDLPISGAITIPEWDVTLYVRTLKGNERDRLEELSREGDGKSRRVKLRGVRARIAALCTVDADGKRVFDEDDMGWLGEKSSVALDRLVEEAMKLNGMTDKDVEDIAKNSESVPSADSGTSSPGSGDAQSAKLNSAAIPVSSPSG